MYISLVFITFKRHWYIKYDVQKQDGLLLGRWTKKSIYVGSYLHKTFCDIADSQPQSDKFFD